MAETSIYSSEKIIPMRVVQDLMEGSYEFLGARLDEAVGASREMFSQDESEEIARLATFEDRVIVGTEGGRYYSVKFEDKGEEGIAFSEDIQELDVPSVDPTNAARMVRECTMDTVDALLSEDASSAKGRILELVSLHEQGQVEAARDFTGEVLAALAGDREWRRVYGEQRNEIHRQVVDSVESISEHVLEPKYKPLYETDDIPEEHFEDYRELVNDDISILSERLETIHVYAESAFLPFLESISTAELAEDESEVLGDFIGFSEDLIEDLTEVRSLLADSAQNEDCVMCLGHIYDSIAESLFDYEVASAFVGRMVEDFNGAE